jgi:hypothetical protein
MAKFPRFFCFHGGEHVLSLFFSSIAKKKPVKVHRAGLLCIYTINDLSVVGVGVGVGVGIGVGVGVYHK